MTPLVSTVIPTFDRREDVVLAVGSALAQTHPAQEVIVVDDGSRDGTADLLRERYGDRVTILRTERLGVSGARNHGMKAARGAYIALLDSDDEWEPEKLAKQVAWLEARPDFASSSRTSRRWIAIGRPSPSSDAAITSPRTGACSSTSSGSPPSRRRAR